MKTAITHHPFTGHRAARIALALTLAVAVSLAPLRSAVANRGEGDDRGRHEQEQHRHRSHREHHPVYAPEPVYYPRHESPGVTLFLPFDIR
jgi:hypothetical protein